MVVSGVNHGPNLGNDVLYSGTVAAAMEGALLGVHAIAVSLASPPSHEFEEAARFAAALARRVVATSPPAPSSAADTRVGKRRRLRSYEACNSAHGCLSRCTVGCGDADPPTRAKMRGDSP